jgi:WD40 repeat protein
MGVRLPTYNGAPIQSSAVASLEYLPFNQKTGYGLLIVGTMDGWIESWKICAYEAEEDEEVVHADEEDATIKLKFVKYFRRLMFHSNLSVISSSVEEKKFYMVALGSSFDERVCILKIPSDFSTGAVILSFSVNIRNYPSSCVWNGKTFWIGCQNGSLCSFTPSRGQKEEKSESAPHACWETSLPSVSNMCAASKGEFLILTSPANDYLRVFSVQSESSSTSHTSLIGETPLRFRNPSKDSTSHGDTVVCMSSSPNGSFVAAGCVDGSVHVWSIISGTIKLAAKVILHKQAVLTISFSVDSSLMMSCGADGSVFISTISAPARLYFKAGLGDSKFYEKVTLDVQSSFSGESENFATSADDATMTWFESRRADALDELKRKSSVKVGEVFSAVEDITLRLKSIIDRNNARNEQIEKLDRIELVVDLDGRDQKREENEALLNSTRNLYAKRNLWNEVSASRVKETCWDSMEAQERHILPFSTEDKNFVASFSIQSRSKQETKRLEIVKRLRAVEIRY